MYVCTYTILLSPRQAGRTADGRTPKNGCVLFLKILVQHHTYMNRLIWYKVSMFSQYGEGQARRQRVCGPAETKMRSWDLNSQQITTSFNLSWNESWIRSWLHDLSGLILTCSWHHDPPFDHTYSCTYDDSNRNVHLTFDTIRIDYAFLDPYSYLMSDVKGSQCSIKTLNFNVFACLKLLTSMCSCGCVRHWRTCMYLWMHALSSEFFHDLKMKEEQ